MTTDPFTITIVYPAEVGLSTRLRITESGAAEYIKESNGEDLATPSIGYYRAEIGAQRARELRDVLDMLDKRPANPQQYPPGVPLILVSLEERSGQRQRSIDPHDSTPAICQVGNEMQALVQEIKRYPQRVLWMRATLQKVAGAKNTLRIAVAFKAEGREPVLAGPPMSGWAPPGIAAGGLAMSAIRSDIPVEKLGPLDAKGETLVTAHLIRSTIAPEGIQLLPGQETELEVQSPLSWSPGRYSVNIIYNSLTSEPGRLIGRITSPPIDVILD